MKTAENYGIWDTIRKKFKLDKEGRVGVPYNPLLSPVYDLSTIPFFVPYKRFYLQHTGDETIPIGIGWKDVAVTTPLPADLHGVTNYESGTTALTTESAVITQGWVIPYPSTQHIRLVGRAAIVLLLGVVSDAAAGTATITKVSVELKSMDESGTTIKSYLTRTLTCNIEADGAAGTTEVKESVVIFMDRLDIPIKDHLSLFLEVTVYAKTGNVAHTTTAKLYHNSGSNDSYIDLPLQ